MNLEPYTIVVTSCDRFDLLRRTIDSLLKHVDQQPEKLIIIEDSGNEEVRDAVPDTEIPVEIIINQPGLGQMKAIDRAYESVATSLVFHCEDDWQFTRSGFVAESQALLSAFPEISMVSLRPRHELNPRVRNAPVETLGNLEFFRMDPSLHPEYFSYSFNPGLRRMSDYHRFAPVADIGFEPDVSYQFKKAGFHMACLENPAVCHIGDERHVDDPHAPKKAKTRGERLKRSVAKRLKRISRWYEERRA